MDLSGVIFRDYQDEDLEWVLLAIVDSMRATMTPERSAETDDIVMLGEARADFDKYHNGTKSRDRVIVAWKDGERIGLVWVTMEQLHQDPGNAWLMEVFVDPRYRGHGLAKEMLDRAEKWARERGAKEIWLNVGGGNRKALGLYESQGYDVVTMHLSKRLTDRS